MLPIRVRMEGLTLPVSDVARSVAFYGEKLGLTVEIDSAPDFALIRVGGRDGGTIGLLSMRHADAAPARNTTPTQRSSIQVELSTDDVDTLYESLKKRGVFFQRPPKDTPWERSMQTRDPDGYTVEFAQGRRGRNAPKKATKARKQASRPAKKQARKRTKR
jgi:predicted enzyme related to lactoylglutathione lyase